MTTSLWLVLIFSCLGLVDTIYLSYHAITKTDVACVFFPKEWCQKVQYSKYSRTFGVPNPYLGLVMYAAILTILWSYIAGNGTSLIWLRRVIGFGFLFSLYFTFIQAFVLRAFCTWCVVSAINFTVMAVAMFI